MTIHLLEDDPAVRDSLMILLRNMGHQVVSYADGESLLRAGGPASEDDVIVDLKLPGMSGADVIKWLQAPERPPRITVMSGQVRQAIEKQLNGISVAHVLRKPLTADDVAACLARRTPAGAASATPPSRSA